MPSSHGLRRGLAAVICATIGGAALAGPPQNEWRPFTDKSVQDFGHQWSKVGDPGNDAYTYQPPFQLPRTIGSTNYKYRVMTREVTVREWFDFVQAYAPYAHPDARGSQQFIGTNGFIQYHGLSGGVPQYSMQEQFGDVPIRVGWRFAARYANFMHNDQADAAAAFESGAYDTSTFGLTQNEMGINVITDQQRRSEGARFWIPSFDEWSKAGHWDPNRYGEGEGGWWQFPTTSDTAPAPGEPDLGGETNGGAFPPGQTRPLDAGSYPDVQSPWGLLDLSGGATEWLEDINSVEVPNQRFVSGSSIYLPGLLPSQWDRLGHFDDQFPTQMFGVRLASVIPSPGTALGLVIWCAFQARKRPRCLSECS